MLAVLAGLLAMHALAPGAAGHQHVGGRSVAHTAAPRTAVDGDGVHDDCAGDGGGCGGGHLRHADPTCSAAALSGAPALPALVPDPVAAPAPTGSLRPCAADAPDGARAPPSLAELQLLRI
ncbi:DUF6153 family protein [Streptomyces hilarionis]|uniref:DUF6153 family protein n=1 Tax=Streptomyces hilarionis TaxID=2839954 RepID=UPI002119DC4F|nr:DUF6153 family protein [Streptomyces hilarionis]MCQ9129910.1 hypothetical protein [Streptomyces hilarionis]